MAFLNFLHRLQSTASSRAFKLRSFCTLQSPHFLSSTKTKVSHQTKCELSTDVNLPSSAEIVIAGAGVVGSSVAYHLAAYGKKDIVVLEQGSLGCGTTWHSVGLLSLLRRSNLLYEMSRYSYDFYSNLEEETGYATGVKKCGSLLVARTNDRAISYKSLYNRIRQQGVECFLLSPKEAQEIYPLIKIDDLKLALWAPNEGVCNASDVCAAMMKGATQKGVRLIEGVKVNRVVTDGRRVVGVESDQGYISCEKFINCGGQWARELGLLTDTPVNLPLHSCEHFYIVTKPMEGVHGMLPVLRDQDAYIYIREWSGGLMAGGFEPVAKPCFYEKGIPPKFEFQLLQEDWDHFDILMQGMMHRIPSMETAEIRQFVNGPESFSPDGTFLFGEAPEVENYYVAAGMNSGGISNSPGMGKLTAELIVNGQCSWDTTHIDVKRFSKEKNNKFYLRDRSQQVLAYHYVVDHPGLEFDTSRPLKTSPLYDVLLQNGAQFDEIGGWERAKWFSPGTNKEAALTFGKPDWLPFVQEEYKACTESVGIADMSWQSKFEIFSNSESALISKLEHLFAEEINIENGSSVNSALLNEYGCCVATATLHRLSSERFLLATSPKQHNTLLWWIQKHLKADEGICITDVTAVYSCLGIFGPDSVQLLKKLTLATLDDLQQSHLKVIDLGIASDVILCRGYLGNEKNWLAFVKSELYRGLYKNVLENSNAKNVGYKAIDLMRIEAGIPEFGSEFGSLSTSMDTENWSLFNPRKVCDFIGKEAILKRKSSNENSVFTLAVNDVSDEIWPKGGEPVYADGKSVGNLSSVSYSFSRKSMIALAVLDNEKTTSAEYLAAEVAGESKRCRIV